MVLAVKDPLSPICRLSTMSAMFSLLEAPFEPKYCGQTSPSADNTVLVPVKVVLLVAILSKIAGTVYGGFGEAAFCYGDGLLRGTGRGAMAQRKRAAKMVRIK